MQPKPSIAIIGSGISGLAAAWLCHKQYEVTIFEQNNYLGGHTNTIEVQTNGRVIPIDTGFIVYNQENYPNLTTFFNWLDIHTQPTEMSFSVSVNKGELEYAGSNLNTLFCQRKQLVNPKFWFLLAEIVRFNRVAKKFLDTNHQSDLSVRSFLIEYRFNRAFYLNYLLPMAAAIWSCPINKMFEFPATSLLQFFCNHGLLNINDRPQWRTVTGGSYQYIKAFLKKFKGNYHVSKPIKTVLRNDQSVILQDSQKSQYQFDQVIFACHADQALKLLERPSPEELSILSQFSYQKNKAYLHHDDSLMPKNKRAWSAWNYLKSNIDSQVSVTYWMNLLQSLDCNEQFYVSLNPSEEPSLNKVIRTIEYHHPVFNHSSISAQKKLTSIQGKKRSWFCGSYAGYGFHEDGFASALSVANKLDCKAPWQQMN